MSATSSPAKRTKLGEADDDVNTAAPPPETRWVLTHLYVTDNYKRVSTYTHVLSIHSTEEAAVKALVTRLREVIDERLGDIPWGSTDDDSFIRTCPYIKILTAEDGPDFALKKKAQSESVLIPIFDHLFKPEYLDMVTTEEYEITECITE